MKIARCLVQHDEQFSEMLHEKLFDVNIRLFKYNKEYRNMILGLLNYMKDLLNTKFEDYAELKGISGANVGIPFNLVVVKNGKGTLKMVNPSYTAIDTFDKRTVKSNCGSINLEESIEVERYREVSVCYHDEAGERHDITIDGAFASTVQHEIDHNNGILITDLPK